MLIVILTCQGLIPSVKRLITLNQRCARVPPTPAAAAQRARLAPRATEPSRNSVAATRCRKSRAALHAWVDAFTLGCRFFFCARQRAMSDAPRSSIAHLCIKFAVSTRISQIVSLAELVRSARTDLRLRVVLAAAGRV